MCMFLVYTYNMLHMLVDHRCWPYFDYHAFQREIAQHANNWCSDWTTLERLAQEENELQEASGEFGWTFLARVPAEAVARWGCDIPDNMVALGRRTSSFVLFWESGRMAYDFLDD